MSTELENIYGQTNIVDDENRGIDLLPEIFKNADNLKGFIESFLDEIQEAQNSQRELFADLNISEAVKPHLDNIFGNLLNLPRNSGESDDDYRARLLTETEKLGQHGSITTMKTVYKALTNATTINLFENFPHHFTMNAFSDTIPSSSELETIRKNLGETKQAGVWFSLSITDSENVFLLDSESFGFDNGILSEGF